MLDFFKKLFRMIFGGGESTATTEKTTPEPKKPEPEKEETTPQVTETYLELKRSNYGEKDTIGELFIKGEHAAYTIESAKSNCLPEGTYTLSLRTEGGKHATYWYKFGDMHKGMLFIEEKNGSRYPTICIGNTGADSLGSILVGRELKADDDPRAVWYSEAAYKLIYPRLAKELESGKALTLTIST